MPGVLCLTLERPSVRELELLGGAHSVLFGVGNEGDFSLWACTVLQTFVWNCLTTSSYPVFSFFRVL